MNNHDMTGRLARLHLDLANKLFQLRIESGQEIADVARTAGIPVERIEMIEEGELLEIVWLFRPNLFSREEIENLGRMFEAVLAGAGRLPETRMAALKT